jgi:hypothetical protein
MDRKQHALAASPFKSTADTSMIHADVCLLRSNTLWADIAWTQKRTRTARLHAHNLEMCVSESASTPCGVTHGVANAVSWQRPISPAAKQLPCLKTRLLICPPPTSSPSAPSKQLPPRQRKTSSRSRKTFSTSNATGKTGTHKAVARGRRPPKRPLAAARHLGSAGREHPHSCLAHVDRGHQPAAAAQLSLASHKRSEGKRKAMAALTQLA